MNFSCDLTNIGHIASPVNTYFSLDFIEFFAPKKSNENKALAFAFYLRLLALQPYIAVVVQRFLRKKRLRYAQYEHYEIVMLGALTGG